MNKQQIIEIVLKELPADHADLQQPIEKLVFKYFVTGRTGEGLRITDQGQQAFYTAGLQEYTYKINQSVLHKLYNTLKVNYNDFILKLNKLLNCPWHLGYDNSSKAVIISVYDSRIAMMINLYGSLEDYIKIKLA